MPDPPKEERRSAPWAFVLSILLPGLGHWYVGRIAWGVWIAFAYAICLWVWLASAIAVGLDPRVVVWTLISAWVLRIAVASHAAWAAKRIADSFVPTRAHSWRGYVAFVVLVGGLGLTGSATMRTVVMEYFKVPSGAMMPTMLAGDHFVVTKIDARDRDPQRGDIIVFPYPEDPTELFVKRVVALPGETIDLSGGVPVVDGRTFDRMPCPDSPPDSSRVCEIERTPQGVTYNVMRHESRPDVDARFDPVVVPAGHVFVLGDNRGQSHDSAAFGPIPIASIEGRARAVWLPFDRAASLEPRRQ